MKLLVYIGRFQPFHFGHLGQIQTEYKDMCYDQQQVRLLMLLGTFREEKRTLKNPFTFAERKQMILESLTNEELHHIAIEPIYNHESDKLWTYEVIQLVNKYKENFFKDDVYLIGDKDEKSSYYLDFFPDFQYTGTSHTGVHATDVRNAYFKEVLNKWEDRTLNQVSLDIGSVKGMVPEGTFNFLKNHAVDKELIDLVREKNNV